MELLGLLVDYAREEKNQEILTASLGTMAVMLMETGELAEARKVFEEILAGATASHDSESVTRSLLNLGIIDARENHSDAAIARFSKALELAESTGDERMAQAARRSLAIAAQEADPAVCPRCHGETWVYAPGYGLQVCPQCKGSGKA
jgi:Tfp pilus assembly protein PilF